MKRRMITLGLCALFTAGVLLTPPRTTSAVPFADGPSASGQGTGLFGADESRASNTRPAYSLTDLFSAGRVSTTLTDAPSVSSPATPEPAAESCAPRQVCMFMGCWYDLLNNSEFEGSSCATKWVFPSGYTPSSSTICSSFPYYTSSKVVVLPNASGFYQDFFVPEDVSGPLEIALQVATVGTPGPSDALILELREGGRLNELRFVPTNSGSLSCPRVDIAFANIHAGKTLRLRVRSAISTPGVQYHIEWIQIFGS